MFIFFPTVVRLRPATFSQNDIFGRLTAVLYEIDAPTNACPSEHVIGSLAVVFAARDTKRFRSRKWFIPITVTAGLICVSVLFVKQHGLIDLTAAIPLSLAAWLVCFGRRKGFEGDVPSGSHAVADDAE